MHNWQAVAGSCCLGKKKNKTCNKVKSKQAYEAGKKKQKNLQLISICNPKKYKLS